VYRYQGSLKMAPKCVLRPCPQPAMPLTMVRGTLNIAWLYPELAATEARNSVLRQESPLKTVSNTLASATLRLRRSTHATDESLSLHS
jgi:hypothetical protein